MDLLPVIVSLNIGVTADSFDGVAISTLLDQEMYCLIVPITPDQII